MRRGAFALLIGLTACGSAEPLQLVRGRVAPDFPGAPVGIRAVQAGDIVGAAPLEGDDAAFLIGIPAGPPTRFELVDEHQARVAWIGAAGAVAIAALELAICVPRTTPVDLGRLEFERGACTGTEICTRSESALRACARSAAKAGCCCSTEMVAVDLCRFGSGHGDCQDVRADLRTCEERQRCEAGTARCEEDCAALLRETVRSCSACGPDSPSARPEVLPPAAIGCEPS